MVLGVTILAVLGISGVNHYLNQKAEKPSSTVTQQTTPITPIQQTPVYVPPPAPTYNPPPEPVRDPTPAPEPPADEPYNVWDGYVAIAPGHYQYKTFKINIPRKITGSFRGSGGSRNDVQVIVLTDFEFQNLANGNRYFYKYDSGRATVGRLNTHLEPGRYYIVVSNIWSIISNKVAELHIQLEKP